MAAGYVEHKLVVLGNQGVGKTALITRLVHNMFDDSYNATVGVDFFTKTVMSDSSGRPIKFQMWDTAGQERFSCLLPAYIRNTTIALIVFDVTKKASFDDVSRWMLEVRTERGNNVTVILIGNKIDDYTHRQVPYEEAVIKAEMMDTSYIETSAKDGQNINELLQMMIREVFHNQKQPRLIQNTPKETEKERKILLRRHASLPSNCTC